MAHYGLNTETRKTTEPKWLGIGAKIGQLVNDWSYRNDLVVYIGATEDNTKKKQKGDETPAQFNPEIAEIIINPAKCFGENCEPSTIGDLSDRMTQLEHAAACGVIFHEALHARFSRYSLESAFEELPAKEFLAFKLLEESRIEALGVSLMPENRVLLRSATLELAGNDIDDVSMAQHPVWSAACAASLILARVDAGVLDERDVEGIRELIVPILGEDTIEKLREVWIAAQAHSDHSVPTALYALAKRWVEIVEEKSKEAGEEQQQESLEKQPGEGGSGGASAGAGAGDSDGEEGDSESESESESEEGAEDNAGNSMSEAFAKALKETLEHTKDMVQIANQIETFEAMSEEENKREVAARNQQTKERNARKAVYTEVFGKGTGPGDGNGTRSKLQETRQPTSDERIAAVKVAKLLEKAKYRERSQTEIRSVLPQGRLRSRALVQNAAYKEIGLHQQAEAWRRTVRRHTDDPTLKIGVMVDISGSMSMAMNPMATTAWVLSEAGRRVQAKTAMVYYGEDVFATLKPGQHLEAVNVYSAPDGTEEFDKAFKALDGALDLLYSDGARMLVVVSDGHYTHTEWDACMRWLTACKSAGVAVLWIGFDHEVSDRRQLEKRGAKVVDIDSRGGIGGVAELIGQTAANALTEIGKRNA